MAAQRKWRAGDCRSRNSRRDVAGRNSYSKLAVEHLERRCLLSVFNGFDVGAPTQQAGPAAVESSAVGEDVTTQQAPPLHMLTTGTGDGNVTVTVDGFGSFGHAVFGYGYDAFYDPVGPIGPAETTFESGVAFRAGSSGPFTFLSAGYIGSSGGLPGPTISGTDTQATSSFTVDGLAIDLIQTVIPLFDMSGMQLGSRLTQTYTITNTSGEPADFELIRYLDGDLYFDGTLIDGGGRFVTSSGEEILFETDKGGTGQTDTTFIGISATNGQSPTSGRYEIDDFPITLYKLTSHGGSLNDSIYRDGDGDGFIDAGKEYDVTLAFRNTFSLPAGGTSVYTTVTTFGSGAPTEIPPRNVSARIGPFPSAIGSAEHLGAVDYLVLPPVNPSVGDLWYGLETMHDAVLTIESLAPDTEIKAFSADTGQSKVSYATSEGQRLDWGARAGQTFYFCVSGSAEDVVIRITNLVSCEETAVTVFGTADDDAFAFDGSGKLRRISINGVAYAFAGPDGFSFDFAGAGGSDDVQLVGGVGPDLAQLRPHRAELTGAGYRVTATGFQSASFDGAGGRDSVFLHGGPGADTLWAGGDGPVADPHQAKIAGDGVSLTARAEFVYAYGHGGHDNAYFWASTGNDAFQPSWRLAQMWGNPDAAVLGDEYYRQAGGFRDVFVHAQEPAPNASSSADGDVAVLQDAAADSSSNDVQYIDEVHTLASDQDISTLAQMLWQHEFEEVERNTNSGEQAACNVDEVLACWD